MVTGARTALGRIGGRRIPWRSLVAPLVVGVIAFAAARWAMLPGLGFWDTAELQAVAPLLGTAHPTGFPTYVILGWLVDQVLAPFGELHCYGYVAGKVPFDLFATDRTLSIKTFNADNFLGSAHFAAATEAMHRRFASGPLLDAGEAFPLARAADAHRAIEAGNVLGKIVLQT